MIDYDIDSSGIATLTWNMIDAGTNILSQASMAAFSIYWAWAGEAANATTAIAPSIPVIIRITFLPYYLVATLAEREPVHCRHHQRLPGLQLLRCPIVRTT